VDAVTGPTVRITGSKVKSGPAAVPITQQDLIPPTLAYQKWIQDRTVELAQKTDAVAGRRRSRATSPPPVWPGCPRISSTSGWAPPTARSATPTGRSTAPRPGCPGCATPGFTGFHRVEYGLWHGESASGLRGAADQLAKDVRALESSWPQQRMDPADTGLRAHEILENTVQFELTGRTDYGSGTNLATARANLDGTRCCSDRLRPLLKTRDPGLPELGTGWTARSRALDASTTPESGPLDSGGPTLASAAGEGERRPRWTGRAAGRRGRPHGRTEDRVKRVNEVRGAAAGTVGAVAGASAAPSRARTARRRTVRG
jgi:iron uptake system component EfeO